MARTKKSFRRPSKVKTSKLKAPPTGPDEHKYVSKPILYKDPQNHREYLIIADRYQSKTRIIKHA